MECFKICLLVRICLILADKKINVIVRITKFETINKSINLSITYNI